MQIQVSEEGKRCENNVERKWNKKTIHDSDTPHAFIDIDADLKNKKKTYNKSS